MNTPTLAARLICAAAAAVTTLLLFSAVVSIAEPQRSELMAKNQRMHKPAPMTTALALASNTTSRTGQ